MLKAEILHLVSNGVIPKYYSLYFGNFTFTEVTVCKLLYGSLRRNSHKKEKTVFGDGKMASADHPIVLLSSYTNDTNLHFS